MPVTVFGGPYLSCRRDTYLDVVELRQDQNEASEQADADRRDRKPHRYRHFVALIRAAAFIFFAAAARAGRVTTDS